MQAIGSDAAWISSHIHVGDTVTLRGQPGFLAEGEALAQAGSGAPVLLHYGTAR